MAWYHNIDDTGIVSHWDDARVAASAVSVGPLKAPPFASFTGGLFTYTFETAKEQQVYFNIQLSHSWKQLTLLHPHYHWSPDASNVGDETLRMGLEYTWAEINGVFPGTTTTIYTEDVGEFTALGHYVRGFDDGIDFTSVSSVSPMLICRLFRDGTDIGDTLAANAHFLEFDIHFEVDAPGSIQPFSK